MADDVIEDEEHPFGAGGVGGGGSALIGRR